MAKTDFKSVDDYLATMPEKARPALDRIRAIMKKTMPGAAEVISYQIPAYKLPGGTALYFAGWKEHVSVYPVTDSVIAAFGEKLDPYHVSRGTLRFPLDKKLPVKLIEGIAKVRAKETAEKKPRPKTKAVKG